MQNKSLNLFIKTQRLSLLELVAGVGMAILFIFCDYFVIYLIFLLFNDLCLFLFMEVIF